MPGAPVGPPRPTLTSTPLAVPDRVRPATSDRRLPVPGRPDDLLLAASVRGPTSRSSAAAGGAPPGSGGRPPYLVIEPGGGTNRLTVLVRLVLAWPHLVVLELLGVLALPICVYGWVAALFLRRLPERVHRFLSGVVAYQVRVSAYVYFLADEYPPFALVSGETDDYPVRAVFPAQGALGRARVLFRAVLILPASVLAAVVGTGLGVLGFFLWIVVLVGGRTPESVRQAVGGVVRFNLRVAAYAWLLTDVYPGGILPRAAPTGPAGVPGLAGEPPLGWSRPPRRSAGAMALTVGFIVLGSLGLVYDCAAVAIPVYLGARASLRNQEAQALVGAYDRLNDSALRFDSGATACRHSAEPTACLQQVTGQFSSSLSAFAASARSVHYNAVATASAGAMADTAEGMALDMDKLANGGGQQALTAYENSGQYLTQQYREVLNDLGAASSPV